MTPTIERLVQALRLLPGVGRKTATRYALALLRADASEVARLAELIGEVRTRVHACSVCHTWTEEDPCEVCRRRGDEGPLCVVEHPGDMLAIEQTGRFRGGYHVLHGVLDPMGGIGMGELTIDALVARVRKGRHCELLLALSPTREGEATARLIATLLADQNVRITRLAYGLPLGSRLEYLDEGTLALALEHRRGFHDSGLL